MAYQEVKTGKLKRFENAGDYVEGYYMGERIAETKYGKTVFLDFKGDEENFSVIKTAGMMANWGKLQGIKVKIQYVGEAENPRTGRKFKNFKIFADFDDVRLPF